MYFGIIESIRGISCLLIVLYHFSSKNVPNGYLGVDQFLIISGFLIIFSIHHNDSKTFNVVDFMNKRVKRILPLKCVVLFYVLLLNKYYLKETVTNLEMNSITAFLFYFNFKLINDNSDYFASRGINLILNYWTLSVEEQYYLYISIISFMTILISNSSSMVLHATALVLSFALFIVYFNKDYIFSFYSIYTRIWEFSCGSLIYYYDFKFINEICVNVLFFFQLLFVFSKVNGYICFIIINVITYFQINYSKNNESCLFSNSMIRYIGRISYSIYLIHYSNIHIFPREYAVLAIIIGSVLMYYVVEKPARNYIPGYIVIILYIISFIFYYKIYRRDFNISQQKRIGKLYVKDIEYYFLQDMCCYDIIDYLYISRYRVLLLGDSHALHYIRALYDNKQEVVLYHSYIGDGDLYNGVYKEFKYLSKYRFDMIIIAFWQSGHRNTTYERNIYLMINEIKDISNNILVISDNPYLSVSPHSCLSTPKTCYGIIGVNCSVVKPYSLSSYKYPKNLNVYDYNIDKHIIKGNKCLFEVDGIPVYRDTYHLTSYFVEYVLMEEIHRLLNTIMKKNIWRDEPITNMTYHCLEREHNIYWYVCRNNKYKRYRIPIIHNGKNSRIKLLE